MSKINLKLKPSVKNQNSLKPFVVKDYTEFNEIDGRHPYKNVGEFVYIEYPVIELNQGRVMYFNFKLAKEIGLIDSSHPEHMNEQLEAKLIETFSIQILNEYDQKNLKKAVKNRKIKKNHYMASRYLQLQHKNKKGQTSGDGRSIWNGFFENKKDKTIWDISSRGTGVTKLSPGSVNSGKALKTGNTVMGYGCGQAEIDELISSAILSEIFHNMEIPTERALCVIDLGKGLGIGVRAAKNLLRPAHAFMFLKQNRSLELKKVIDYHLTRNNLNHTITKNHITNKDYKQFLQEYIIEFAKFTAQIEQNYIFVWLDWDGDNLLMNPGILDYGSVRYFGKCHNSYKYDDVDRYSTNLKEQKNKAILLVNEMTQAIEYIITGNKKNLKSYLLKSKSKTTKQFNFHFNYYQKYYFLIKMGYSEPIAAALIRSRGKLVNRLYQIFNFWENLKSNDGIVKVADGINHQPLVNMREFLRETPELIRKQEFDKFEFKDFINLVSDSNKKYKDEKNLYKKEIQFLQLKKLYLQLFEAVKIDFQNVQVGTKFVFNEFKQNAEFYNPDHFLSGNGLIHCVADIIDTYKKLNSNKSDLKIESCKLVQDTVLKIIEFYSKKNKISTPANVLQLKSTSKASTVFMQLESHQKELWNKIMMNMHDYKNEI